MTDQSPYERIRIANERMTITEACRYIEMDLGDFSVASMKTYCPFGDLNHDDGGISKAFSVYPATNSAYCFACAMYFTPVKLVAADRDVPEFEAAEIILEHTGYVAPDFAARWDAAVAVKNDVDYDGLTNALKIACGHMVPDWEDRQLEDEVAGTLQRCFSAAYKVTNDEEARQWLDITKTVMRRALDVSRKETV